MIDLSFILSDEESAVSYAAIWQVLCVTLLQEDADFTNSQAERLSPLISPAKITMIAAVLQSDPGFISRVKINSTFTLPSDYEELVQTVTLAQNRESGILPPEYSTEIHPSVQNEQPMCDDAQLSSDTTVSEELISPYQPIDVIDTHNVVQISTDVEHMCQNISDSIPIENGIEVNEDLQGECIEIGNMFNLGVTEQKNFLVTNKLGSNRFVFENLVYAPPNSGKSSFMESNMEITLFDTDNLTSWDVLPPKNVITNMSHLIRYSRRSLAIIPQRSVFESRCIARGLKPKTEWYDDILLNARYAEKIIYTDDYLGNIVNLIGWLRESF